MMLFDLEADPAEQHDVAKVNSQVMERLKALFDKMDVQAPKTAPPERHGGGGIRRLTGGELWYDREPAAAQTPRPSERKR